MAMKNPRLRKREFNVDARKVNIGVTLANICISLVLAGTTYMGIDNYQTKFDTAKAEISELKGELNDLKGQSSQTNVKEIQQSLNSATTLGQTVTELQNTWGKSLTAEDDEAFRKSEGESVDALNTTRISRLRLAFSDNASAGWSNWYPRITGTKSMDATWKFITTTSFTTVKQNVMWQATTESGELYAYVTAVYNADNDTFENVSVNITTAGVEAQSAQKGA